MEAEFQTLKTRVMSLPKKKHSSLLTAFIAGCAYNSNHNNQAMKEAARVLSTVIEVFEDEEKEQQNVNLVNH